MRDSLKYSTRRDPPDRSILRSETQTYHKGDVCIYDGERTKCIQIVSCLLFQLRVGHEWLAKRTSTGKEPGSYASDWKRFDFNDEE